MAELTREQMLAKLNKMNDTQLSEFKPEKAGKDYDKLAKDKKIELILADLYPEKPNTDKPKSAIQIILDKIEEGAHLDDIYKAFEHIPMNKTVQERYNYIHETAQEQRKPRYKKRGVCWKIEYNPETKFYKKLAELTDKEALDELDAIAKRKAAEKQAKKDAAAKAQKEAQEKRAAEKQAKLEAKIKAQEEAKKARDAEKAAKAAEKEKAAQEKKEAAEKAKAEKEAAKK